MLGPHPSGPIEFFVSYTQSDQAWAEWIAWELEAHGHRVKIQAWDFRPGNNFVEEMQRAAIEAPRTIAVMSPEYFFKSKFTGPEWTVAFQQGRQSGIEKLLPVRVVDFQPQGLFGPLVYVDLVGKSQVAARAALLAALESGRTKPHAAPSFPGGVPGVSPAASSQPLFPGSMPGVWTVPVRNNPDFIGRGKLLEQIALQFASGSAAALVIHGLGGMGKTQVAVEYAYAHRFRYDAVFWVVGDSASSLHANVASLAGAQALNLGMPADSRQADVLDTVILWLRGHDRWLLILDNVDSEEAEEAVADLVQRIPVGHILLTSRRADWPATLTRIAIERLDLEPAVEFLLSRTGATNAEPSARAEAAQIARELDGFPLGLEQAAAYILRNRSSFARYLHEFHNRPAHVLRYFAKGATDYKQSVYATWSVSEAALGSVARTVLSILGFLAPEAIPRELFVASAPMLADADAASGGSVPPALLTEDDIEQALAELADYSFIALSATELSGRPLVMEVQRAKVTPDERRIHIGLALKVVDAMAPRDRDEETWPIWRRVSSHAAALLRYADADGIVERTRCLRWDLAAFFEEQARFGEAEGLRRRAVEIDEVSYGRDAIEVASRRRTLGKLLAKMGALPEAEQQLRRAVEIVEAHPPQAEMADVYSSLAEVLGTARGDEAEGLLRRALEIAEATDGPRRANVAFRTLDLARFVRDRGRASETEPLFRAALEIQWKLYEPSGHAILSTLKDFAEALLAVGRNPGDDPMIRRALETNPVSESKGTDAALDLHSRAKLLEKVHRHADAVGLLERALQIDESIYGPHHPWLARDLSNLADLYAHLNHPEQAEESLRRALEIQEKSFGIQHPETAETLMRLAGVLQRLARFPESETLLQRAFHIQESAYGASDSRIVPGLNALASLYKETNRLRDAERLLRRALEVQQSAHGAADPLVASAFHELAMVLRELDRPAECEDLLRQALEIDERARGSSHKQVATDLIDLALVLDDAGKVDEAEPLLQRAIAIREAWYGSRATELALPLNNLGTLMRGQHRFEEGESLLLRALEIEDPTGESQRPSVAGTLNNLALLLRDCGRPKEAEPLQRRVLAIYEASYGGSHPRVATALSNLALTLEDGGDPDAAEPLLRRALAIDEAIGAQTSLAVHATNLGILLWKTGRLEEAVTWLSCAAAAAEKSLGPDHPKTRSIRESLDAVASSSESAARRDDWEAP